MGEFGGRCPPDPLGFFALNCSCSGFGLGGWCEPAAQRRCSLQAGRGARVASPQSPILRGRDRSMAEFVAAGQP